MGFATSITIAIIFMGCVIIATIVYPLIFHSYNDIQDSIKEKHALQIEELNTRIGISSAISGSGTINITLSNDGSTVLNAGKSNVLLDGVYSAYSVNPDGLWLPGKTAVFTLDADSSIIHTIKIITENGISIYREI